ncbi:MAG TPA: aldo/keto reductase [Streptosporangiaceae bacterium]|nr:aldo/keto reductase [Streptosporangiaceae bacterium]
MTSPKELGSVKLGRTGLHVTRMVFGGGPIGGLFAPVRERTARATLEAAWSAGIRAFDTAPHYGVGLSEQRIGSFLRGLPRDDYVLSTKVGRLLVPTEEDVEGAESFYGTPRARRVSDYSRDGVLASLESSMARLGTDRIDIALVHDPDDHMEQALDEALPALADLRAGGVVGAVGVGMNSSAPLHWFVSRADLDCVLVAGRYTLLDTEAARMLLPECQRRGVAVLAGGVFNSGILADGPGATYDYATAPGEITRRAKRIHARCIRYGVALPAAALHFTLAHPAVTAALVGVRKPTEIISDVSYLHTEVPVALYEDLTAEGLLPPGAVLPGATRPTL